uniref:MalT-like TPR region domain-containing protein n=1 Tax=Micromonas pusilla TaxID=38833 RepID=A0A7S0PR94_MICPS|mmetsp:Transcript_12051/g.48355  ORF Transcript_12051/g.48355 Transcript_12051/m.48355 type:complete len:255 (-) Transcript_12051:163-927(-)
MATLENVNGLNPQQVPALVMRSVENARSALDDGDFERAIKMMNSTDQLCSKVVAPPTVHGLAMRVLSDAYVKKGELESAKAALEKGLALCKPHDGRAGMPPFMRADLNGRMGDLLMALGEIHRTEGDAKGACRRMRQAIERFHVLGQNEFVAATHNRIALTLIEQGKHKLAMDEITEAEKMGAGNEHEAAILSTTFSYKGKCLEAGGDVTGAREAFTKALSYGMACGNEGVVQEAEAFLGQTQDQSTIDQDAFL